MKSKQLGLSPIGILAFTCLFALAVVLALKLTTHFIDYYQIKGIFERIQKDPEIEEMDEDTIYKKIQSRIYISGLRDFKMKDSTYIAIDDEGEVLLEFNYEVREHILGNLDVILSFSYSSNPEAVVTDTEAEE